MRALLRKDAVWLLVIAVAGLLAGLVAMADGGAGLWYRPDVQTGEASLIFYWIAAGVLGLDAGLFEDGTFTREYLLHRPVSLARMFWIRQLGCGLVLATWILVMPALHLAGVLLFLPNGVLAEPGRWWSLVNQGSVAVAFYAVALFSATVVRRWLLGVLLAAALSLALLLFFALAVYSQHPRAHLMYLLLAPMSFAIALPLLLASLRLARDGRDLDRPVSRARLVAAGVGVALFSLVGSLFLHILQLDLRRDVHGRYPNIARLPDGTPVLVTSAKPDRTPYRVDQSHQRIEGTVEKAELVFEPLARQSFERRDRDLASGGRLSHGVRYQRVMCSVPAFCYVGTDGLLHVFPYDADGGPMAVRHVGKADGGHFSRGAQVLGYWGRAGLMADPQDGGVWRYDIQKADTPGFTRVALPGGDRFSEDLSNVLQLPRQYNDLFAASPLVVRGERGIYVADREGFQPAPPEVQEAVARLDRRRQRPRPEVVVEGPMRFRVSLPASAEGPAFSHAYAPRTWMEKGLALQMQALSLLRPPLLAAISPLARPVTGLGNPTDEDARIFLDPRVMQGDLWMLVLDLLLGAGLAALTFRRLGRLQLPAGRRAYWTALVAASGVIGYLVCRACENKRAWHAMEVAQAPAPLLIRSAA